jgi:hypothetical protein
MEAESEQEKKMVQSDRKESKVMCMDIVDHKFLVKII